MKKYKKLKYMMLPAIMLFVGALVVTASPPETLTVGGEMIPDAYNTSISGSVWRVYSANESEQQTSGIINGCDSWFCLWSGNIDEISSGFGVGTDCIATISQELNGGTLSHTGYYAVVNHILTGDDPAEFPDMTLRQIPVPSVTADAWAYLNWSSVVEDAGENGATNIVGYNVYRSSDGINYTKITPVKVTHTQFTDPIPNDAEYTYAISLVFRGNPPVESSVLSANSQTVFKDTDMDTLPDYYEIANGLDETSGAGTNGPAGDADGDTMSNYEEWIAGTKANDRTSALFVKNVTLDGAGITIQWNGIADRRYSLYRSSTLLSNAWTRIYGPTYCPSNQIIEYIDQSTVSNSSFYRISVSR